MANIALNLDSLSPQKFKKTVRHKVKDGVNTFRFLPPFGEDSNGFPYRKWSVVWGLSDPNSGRMRPYASSSTYEGQCPVYDYLDALKAKVEKEKSEMLANGKDEDFIKTHFKPINDFISRIRPKTVFAYNAADKSGTVGVVELKSTAHKDVLKVMNQYIKDYNQDPTTLSSEPTDSGVWINVLREGEGFETKYSAQKNQTMFKNEQGIPSYQDDRTALAQNIVDNYDSLAYDLNSIYEKKTYEELKEILVANLLDAADDMPELLVESFGLEEFNRYEQPAKPQGEKPVETKVDASAEESPKQPATTPKETKSQDSGNDKSADDLLAMADEIFKS